MSASLYSEEKMLNSEVLCALPHNELMRTLAMSTSILRRFVTDGQGMK